MRRFVLFAPIALVSFFIGLIMTDGLSSVRYPRPDERNLPVAFNEISPPVQQPEPAYEESTPDNAQTLSRCGDDYTARDIRKMAGAWASGRRFKGVPHCPKSLAEAEGYSGANILPEYLDLNNDGKPELVLNYGCSATGNCDATIYQRSDRDRYRLIFQSRSMVQHFKKQKRTNYGYVDLLAMSHGSCCDGGQVLYRFDGRKYRPISCAGYSYWDDINAGKKSPKVVITQVPCSKMLDE